MTCFVSSSNHWSQYFCGCVLCRIHILTCLTEVMLLVKDLQLLSACEICNKNTVLLQPSALGQYTGHLTATLRQSGIPVQGQLNSNGAGGRKCYSILTLLLKPCRLTVVKLFPQMRSCCCLLIKHRFSMMCAQQFELAATSCPSNHKPSLEV